MFRKKELVAILQEVYEEACEFFSNPENVNVQSYLRKAKEGEGREYEDIDAIFKVIDSHGKEVVLIGLHDSIEPRLGANKNVLEKMGYVYRISDHEVPSFIRVQYVYDNSGPTLIAFIKPPEPYKPNTEPKVYNRMWDTFTFVDASDFAFPQGVRVIKTGDVFNQTEMIMVALAAAFKLKREFHSVNRVHGNISPASLRVSIPVSVPDYPIEQARRGHLPRHLNLKFISNVSLETQQSNTTRYTKENDIQALGKLYQRMGLPESICAPMLDVHNSKIDLTEVVQQLFRDLSEGQMKGIYHLDGLARQEVEGYELNLIRELSERQPEQEFVSSLSSARKSEAEAFMQSIRDQLLEGGKPLTGNAKEINEILRHKSLSINDKLMSLKSYLLENRFKFSGSLSEYLERINSLSGASRFTSDNTIQGVYHKIYQCLSQVSSVPPISYPPSPHILLLSPNAQRATRAIPTLERTPSQSNEESVDSQPLLSDINNSNR